MIVTESTFLLYAAKHYVNPVCRDDKEFFEDLGRIRNLQRLLSRYVKTGELKERLILNHLIVLYNVFVADACTKILMFKLRPYLPFLKPFLVFLARWSDNDHVDEGVIGSDITMDQRIVDALRRI